MYVLYFKNCDTSILNIFTGKFLSKVLPEPVTAQGTYKKGSTFGKRVINI